MVLPGRTYATSVDGYRFSHNGQEKDNDIFIGALSAEYWEYDSRTGRRWNLDPITHDWESPYATFSNNPIVLNDINGLADGTKRKNKSDQPKFGKKHTKKEQRKINRIHRKHERWTRKQEKKHRKEDLFNHSTDNGKKKSLFSETTIMIGNNFANGMWSPNKSLYQTDIHHPLGVGAFLSWLSFLDHNENDITEGNHLISVQSRIAKTQYQTGFLYYKEKTHDDANLFGYEAIGPLLKTLARDFPIYNNRNFGINLNIGVGVGTAIGAPRLNGVLYSGGMFGYRPVGAAAAAFVRLDATTLKTIIVSIWATYTHINLAGFHDAPSGSQSASSYDTFTVKASIGLKKYRRKS